MPKHAQPEDIDDIDDVEVETVLLPPVPHIDGGGDDAHEIYVQSIDNQLTLYHAASDHARTVWIGARMHEHCGDHNGRWVYRATV